MSSPTAMSEYVRKNGFRTNAAGQTLEIHEYQDKTYVRDNRDVLLPAIQAQVKQNAGIEFDVQEVDDGTPTNIRPAIPTAPATTPTPIRTVSTPPTTGCPATPAASSTCRRPRTHN